MAPVGVIFEPFPPKTGTNLLHPRPRPQSLNGSPADREGEHAVSRLVHLRPLRYLGKGSGGCGLRRLFTLSGGAFGMHTSGSRERARVAICFSCFRHSFCGRCRGKEKECQWLYNLCGGTFSMYASGWTGRARGTYCLAPLGVQFSLSEGQGLGYS